VQNVPRTQCRLPTTLLSRHFHSNLRLKLLVPWSEIATRHFSFWTCVILTHTFPLPSTGGKLPALYWGEERRLCHDLHADARRASSHHVGLHAHWSRALCKQIPFACFRASSLGYRAKRSHPIREPSPLLAFCGCFPWITSETGTGGTISTLSAHASWKTQRSGVFGWDASVVGGTINPSIERFDWRIGVPVSTFPSST
jgi:hypothetical protein